MHLKKSTSSKLEGIMDGVSSKAPFAQTKDPHRVIRKNTSLLSCSTGIQEEVVHVPSPGVMCIVETNRAFHSERTSTPTIAPARFSCCITVKHSSSWIRQS